MPAQALPQTRAPAPGLPVATLLHLAILILLALAAMQPHENAAPLPESSVDVELLTPGQFEAATTPPPVELPQLQAPPRPVQIAPVPQAAPVPELRAQPEPVVPPAEPGTMIKARRMLSETALADPRSRQARDMLPHLAEDERVEQLCSIEAMSQIHAWRKEFEPDRLAAYAMADTKLSGRILLADGAAFRSKRHWYNLRFKCEFTSDRKRVAAFEFLVGEAVPSAQWEAHGLPPVH
jgi:hypothetical protein